MRKTITTILAIMTAVTGMNAQSVVVQLKNGTSVSYPASDVVQVQFLPDSAQSGDKHQTVDLGLSVLWATTNVGTDIKTGAGDYFAWGETQPKDEYAQGNCPNYGANVTWNPETNDAAFCNWGNGWRMPTYEEMLELINECDWEWKVVDGVQGYVVTAKKEGFKGNNIFIPAVGYKIGHSTTNLGTMGYLWTSTPSTANRNVSRNLQCSENRPSMYFSNRFLGLPVRAVKAK